MRADLRRRLLQHLEALTSDAESADDPNIFLAVPEHGRALRPEIVVIEGGRGAGKTELFKALTQYGTQLEDLYQQDFPKARWVEAFSLSQEHPSTAVIDAQAVAMSDGDLRNWWLWHLARRLGPALGGEITVGGSPEVTRDADAVDRIETKLAGTQSYLFATYDYLDKIGSLDPSVRRRYVKALLALWLSLSTRYKWLRAKIFLRPDLFADGQSDFPDASKLRSRAQSLQWTPDDLFRLVARHLANRGPYVEEARHWLRDSAKISLTKTRFGMSPEPFSETERKSFADALAGETMGAGARKGYTYRWITNHLQDGGGRIAPRSILNLMGLAARLALGVSNRGTSATLMNPSDLQGALGETSRRRALELIEEHSLVERLEHLRGKRLLLERSEAQRLLAKPGPKEQQTNSTPTDGALVLDELQRLGVISIRGDGRIDVPDIFRSGFGILRQGGTKIAR